MTQQQATLDLETLGNDVLDLLWGREQTGMKTAVEHAYEMIWRQLLTGRRQPGERLSDTELVEELGVSRTPVRQALYLLAQEGLIRFDRRRGFSVQRFTAQDVNEIYEVRAVLEALALREGIGRIDPNGLKQLLAEIGEIRSQMEQNPGSQFLRNDIALHNLIARSSGNKRLTRMLGSLRSQVTLFQARDTMYPNRITDALDYHERILKAMLDGDTDSAVDLLTEHIHAARDFVREDLFPDGNHRGNE